MVAASVILAMAATATASVKLGTIIEEAGVGTGGVTGASSSGTGGTGGYSHVGQNESIENIQIASEISQLQQQVPKGYSIINESIVGGYYIAFYDSDEVETVPCGEDVPKGGGFVVCFHLVHDYHVLVHKFGSNETTIYDPRVWALSEEYGKG